MSRAVKLKVCGMKDAANIRAVASVHPDYMGFIFYKNSPRYVGDDFHLPEQLPDTIEKIGVFVNQPVDEVVALLHKNNLLYAQLHGDEGVEYCLTLRSKGINIIKVFRVNEAFDFSSTKPFEEVTDFFLFDTKGKYYGGNAVQFDWNILDRYNQNIPFFISGGIKPEDVSPVRFRNWNIHAVDINSGVEREPGLKDLSKVKQVIINITV
jgi:phosphoribosylanthranilate isomerase